MKTVASDEAPTSPEEQGSHQTVTLYMESSALLRILLEGDPLLEKMTGRFEAYLTSALTLVEVPRVLSRARREERLTEHHAKEAHGRFAAFVRSCTVAEITREVRVRAALDFPLEPVRSLDAIHLATVAVWGDTIAPMVVASTDERVRRNALALGYALIPESADDG
jgi:predicted nucleic acid-binding protein